MHGPLHRVGCAIGLLEWQRPSLAPYVTVTGHRRYAIVSDTDLREMALKLARRHDAVQGHNHGHSSRVTVDSQSLTAQNS